MAHSVTSQLATRGASVGAAASSSLVSRTSTKVVDQAFTAGFTTAFRVAAAIVLSGFIVALFTTWTGHWRLSSAVRKGRAQPCDEVLGTCEV